jgi:hypothetical protein
MKTEYSHDSSHFDESYFNRVSRRSFALVTTYQHQATHYRYAPISGGSNYSPKTKLVLKKHVIKSLPLADTSKNDTRDIHRYQACYNIGA